MDKQLGEMNLVWAQSVVDVMLAPVVVIDASRRILFANQAWQTRSAAEHLQQPYEAQLASTLGLDASAVQQIIQLCSEVLASGQEACVELPFVQDGMEEWMRVRVAPMGCSAGGEPVLAIFHTNISTGILTREALKQSEVELATKGQILDHIRDAVITVDLRGIIISWNPGAARIFGYDSSEAVGRNIRLIQPSNDFCFQSDILDKMQDSDIFELEGLRRHRDGRLFYAHTSVSFLRDNQGNKIGVIGYTIDISEKKRIAEELEASLQQLEDALRTANELSVAAKAGNEAKSEFLANVSHEIRTPMNGIVGMTELLLGTRLDEEQLDYANTIKRSAASLLRVLNDVLDFSRSEAGKIELEHDSFDLRTLLEDVVDLFAPQAQAKGVELMVAMSPSCHSSFIGDAFRVRQIVTNLVGNAVKFTNTGEIILSADGSDTEDGVRMRIAVADTGVGIPKHRQAAVFESFTQADASTTRKHGGTGLGLAICRNLCQLMEGSLWLESELGAGSIFTVELLLVKDPRASQQDLAQLPVCGGKRVLVLDANAAHRRLVSSALTSWGAECVSVASVQNVEPTIGSFDVVVADEMTDAPLFSSGRVIGMYRVGVHPHGHASYAAVISKPIKLRALHRALERVLGGSKAPGNRSAA
jgi:PAS domain S-box-containing protein